MGNKQTPSIRALYRFIACALSVATGIAFANDHDDLSFFNTDIPIVLSATRLAQPQTEAPATITITDRQMIKVSGTNAATSHLIKAKSNG